MISVIIPTYKSFEALDLCLKSAIRGQSNKNQIIVVVDGHYDINKEVLNKYSKDIEVLDLGVNMGACKAINLGVYNASSDKILLVNDDNVFPKNWDTKLEEIYKPGCVCTPNQIEPNPSMFPQFNIFNLGTSVKGFNLEKFWEYEATISKNTTELSGSTFPIFMNKIDYLKVGGFDESFPSQAGFATDWEFFLKCNLNGFDMVRSYNCHFYHFVALTNKSSEQKAQSAIEERECHEYIKYKWGKYIQHNPQNNLKFI